MKTDKRRDSEQVKRPKPADSTSHRSRVFNVVVCVFCCSVPFVYFPESPYYRLMYLWTLSTMFLAAVFDSPMFSSPHPFLWKLVLAFTVVLGLSFFAFSFFDRDTQRDFMIYITPETSGSIDLDRDYSMSCDIYDRSVPEDPFHNIKSIVVDEFVITHFLGWILQAVILRDYKTCWMISIMFEFLERSLKHWFVNFNECWWDSFILDVIITNGAGIYIGMRIVDKIALNPFNKKKIFRFRWQPLRSLRMYFSYLFVAVTLLSMIIVLFALKLVLQMSTLNPFLKIFMLLNAAVGLPAVTEVYLFATKDTNEVGPFTLATLFMTAMQYLVVYRSREGYFTEPAPLHVKCGSIILASLLLVFPVVWFGILKKNKY